jgi:hypothetical protein
MILVFVPFTCFYYACGKGHTPQGQGPLSKADGTRVSSPTPTAQQLETTFSYFLKHEFTPLQEQERAAIVRAWNKVPDRENYVIRQHDYGEIAGAYGLASLVVERRWQHQRTLAW